MSKKITKSKPAKVAKFEEPVAKKLDQITLLRILRTQAELKNAQTQMNAAALALRAKLQELDPSGQLVQLQMDMRAHQATIDRFSNDYRQICAEINQKMGLDLKDYSFDDETGILHKL